MNKSHDFWIDFNAFLQFMKPEIYTNCDKNKGLKHELT